MLNSQSVSIPEISVYSKSEMVMLSEPYLGLSQCLIEEDTPPPHVLLHSSQGDHRPQPPSTPSGRVPYATHTLL